MNNRTVQLNKEDYNLEFLEETLPVEEPSGVKKKPFKIIIADDDLEMHSATKMLLRKFKFEGHGLELYETFSGAETIELLKKEQGFALILLDVVMEENDSGLKVVDFIRKVQGNKKIRIILRTGQPGEAPEERIIVEYDINDYRLKTELTVQRLFTSIYEALRSYRDLMELEHNRKGLEQIIDISSRLFTLSSIEDFYSCILDQLLGFRNSDASVVCFREQEENSGFIFLDRQTFGTIIAATGKYSDLIGKNVEDVLTVPEIMKKALEVREDKMDEIIPLETGYLIYKAGKSGFKSFIYVEGPDLDLNLNLIRVFLTNYSLALDNFLMNQQMLKTQKDIISTLGDTIEVRSKETGNHTRRVGRFTVMLAKALGMSEEVCSILEVASTLHDVGKIGIPDAILTKPGKLDVDEFEVIKGHSEIGFHMLESSDLEILRWAAEISRYHHERYDGNGYPTGRKGEDIPINARIVGLADVFDALTHARCYKEAWTFQQALEYVIANSGSQFDPVLVDAFVKNAAEVRKILEELSE